MFGARLREARKAKGYTLDEVAEKYNALFNAKLNKSTLSLYENGKQEPLISVVKNLATVLETSVDYLTEQSNRQSINDYPISDSDLKFALFNGQDGITDEMLEEVRQFAEFVKNKK